MTTTTPFTPTSSPAVAGPSRAAATSSSGKVRMRQVIHGEWIKFRSLRSTFVTLICAGLTTVLFGLFFSAASEAGTQARGPSASLTDPVDIALGGTILTEIIIGALGVIFVTSEYTTGLIQSTFTAVGSRRRVVAAKAAVLATAVGVMGAVSIPMAIVGGQAVYAGAEATTPTSELVAVMAGTTVYLVGIALIGAALAFVFRSTAASIGTLVGGVFIGPNLLPLLPSSMTDLFLDFMPSEAGSAMMANVSDPDALSRGAAYGVFIAWVIGFLAIANFLVQRRDA